MCSVNFVSFLTWNIQIFRGRRVLCFSDALPWQRYSHGISTPRVASLSTKQTKQRVRRIRTEKAEKEKHKKARPWRPREKSERHVATSILTPLQPHPWTRQEPGASIAEAPGMADGPKPMQKMETGGEEVRVLLCVLHSMTFPMLYVGYMWQLAKEHAPYTTALNAWVCQRIVHRRHTTPKG